MEEEREVKTFRVDFRCPKCGIGYLRHNGAVLTSHPAQYPHSCQDQLCGYTQSFPHTYPYIRHE